MEKLWVVRSNGGEFIEEFLSDSIVAINMDVKCNLANKSLSEIRNILCKLFPTKEKSIPNWAGILNNFVNNIKIGDSVITYDPSSRLYYIGNVKSDYYYTEEKGDCIHARDVEWNINGLSRDLLKNETKNSLGATLTVFQLKKDQEKEIFELFNPEKINSEKTIDIKEENNENAKMLIENAKESLKDAIQSLDANDMEELFKEILNAMGYIAQRSKIGSDRSIDVFASKDGLGLEEPRIYVEVKHRKGKMGSQDLRTFIGGRKESDKCLYISTGGFTKEARYEAERAKVHLKLIDIDDLAGIITRHYDSFTAEGKTLLPLKKVYLPIG